MNSSRDGLNLFNPGTQPSFVPALFAPQHRQWGP
jgi:hypothetical protein